MTEIIQIPIEKLLKADWNYKTDGTEEQIKRLAESIKHDESAGVPAVREMDNGFYEVIDGNHRLDGIKLLGWKTVSCENFGKISKAEAVLIARRRNFSWFDDDIIKYAKLLKDDVLLEYNFEELTAFMPETAEQLKDLVEMLDFDMAEYSKDGSAPQKQEKYEIKVKVDKGTFDKWNAIKGGMADYDFIQDILMKSELEHGKSIQVPEA